MFGANFSRFFRANKKQPIRKAKKREKRALPQVELLESRVVPTTISQWAFTTVVAAPDNSPAATTDITGGSAQLTTLGMTNTYNGGNTANDDVENPGDTNVPSELGLRVRGTTHNGWATNAAGAAEYTQGIQLDTSTAGYGNVTFSFDWSSTAQGIRDLQVQYNLNATGAVGGGTNAWLYVPGSGTTAVVNSSIGGTYIANPNEWYAATTPNITVSLPTSVNNDPNLGIRLVSAFDSTQNVPNDYAGATLTSGHTTIYNNSSGNWQFNNLTFSGTATSNTPPVFSGPTSTSVYGGMGGPSGQTQTFNGVAAAGSPAPTFSLNSAPAWVTINSVSGQLIFGQNAAVPTVTSTTPTPYSITIQASNTPGLNTGTATETFMVYVTPTISYTSASPTPNYSQTFSSLPDTGGTATISSQNSVIENDLTLAAPNGGFGATVNTALAGWYAANIDGGGLKFAQGVPSTTTGALFDFNDGSGGNGPALGTISTSSVAARFGAVFVNNTGATLNTFDISYTGEEWWANSGSGTGMTFSYLLGAPGIPTAVNAGTATGLGFGAPSGTGSAVDPPNLYTSSGGAVTGISWAPGEALTIFWDKGTTGSSNGLGIANVQFNAQNLAQLPPAITSAPSAYATVGASAGNYQVTATGFPLNNPSYYTVSGLPAPLTSANVYFDPTTPGQLDFVNMPALPANTGDQAFNFTININNGIGSPATQAFTLIETVSATSFTAGDLLLLQTGNNNVSGTKYNNEAPVSLQEVTPTDATPNTNIQENVPIPDNTTIGGSGNQPVSLDLATTINKNGTGVGQLQRSFNSSSVSFGGNDEQLDDGKFTTANRDIGVVGVNPTAAGGIDTTTYGVFAPGDDNRGAVEANSSTLYDFNHTSGLDYLNGTGNSPTNGTEVDTSAGTASNIRDAMVGFDGTLYYSTDKGAGPGIFISVTGTGFPTTGALNSLPTAAGTDYEIIPTPAGQGNPNGMFLADMNGDGILDTGDRMYYLESTGGLYVSSYTSPTLGHVYGTWSAPVAVIGGAPTPVSGSANYLGITGQVNGANDVQLYFTSADGTGNSTVWSLDDVDTGTAGTGQTPTVIDSTSNSSSTGMQYNGIAFAPIAATSAGLTINGVTTPVAATYPAAVTFTVTLSSPNAPASGNWPGVVYFIDSNSGTVLNPGGTVVPNNGVVTFMDPSGNLPAGQYNVHAYYAGTASIAAATSNSDTLSITGPQTDSLMFTSSPNSSTAGATVTFTVTVTGTSPGGTTVTPTGNVTLIYNGQPIDVVPMSNTQTGSAMVTLNIPYVGLPVGTDPITMFYSGDNTYQSGTSSLTQVVNAGATITVSAPDNGTTMPDSAVTFTATVSGNGLPGTPNLSPTGSVEFFEDGSATAFATGTLTGSGNTLTATGTLSGIMPGSHLITATYLPSSSQYVSVSTGNPPWIESAQQALTPGDLVVLARPNNASNASNLIYLDEYTTAGALVETIILPDANNAAYNTHIVALSGHASSEGALELSGDGNFLSVAGFDLAIGTPSATSTNSATVPRSVATIDLAGTIDSSVSLTVPGSTALDNIRGAVTENGQQVWVVGNTTSTGTGIQYAADGTVGTPTPVGPNNVEGYGAEILGGQLYVSTPSGDVIDEVGNGLPNGTSALTALPGLPAAYASAGLFVPSGAPATITPNPYGFLLFNHLTGTAVDPDTLYIADQTYGLLKFEDTTEVNGSPTTGTWVFEGQKLYTNNGIEGLSGYEVGAGTADFSFVIYATAALSTGNPGNQVVTLTDNINAAGAAFGTPNIGVPFTLFNPIVTPSGVVPSGDAVLSGLSLAPGYTSNTTLSDTGSNETYAYTANVTSVGSSTLPPAAITMMSGDGTTVTVTTQSSLNVSVNQTIQITGVGAAVDGDYVVTGVNTAGPNTFTYASSVTSFTIYAGDAQASIVVGNNVPTGYVDFSVDGGTPSQMAIPAVAITNAAAVHDGGNLSTVTVTTMTPLTGIVPGQTVAVAGISPSGYNGNVTVLTVSGASFTYNVNDIDQNLASPGTVTGATATNGVATFAPGALTAGSHTITAGYEGDVLDGTSTGVLSQAYSATEIGFSAGNLIADEVSTGGTSTTNISNIAQNGGTMTNYLVMATSTAGIAVGDTVAIENATGFSGTFTVTSVNTPSANEFTITAATGIASWTGTGTATVTAVTISTITSAATYTVTTASTTNISVGDSVAISSTTGYNGTYTVTSVNSTANTFTVIAPAGISIWTGSGTAMDITSGASPSLSKIALSVAIPTTYFVTTTSTAGFAVGDSVTIPNGATGFGGTYTITSLNTPTANTFTITAAPAIATYTYSGTGTQPAATLGNASGTSILEYTTAAGQLLPVQMITLPSSGSDAITEGASATKEGYLADSSDGHTVVFAGYNASAYTTTTGANAVIGVVNPNGSIESSTQIPNADTTIGTSNSVKAVASADGLGFYVATNDYIQYVPFGNNVATPTTAVSNFFTGNAETGGSFQSSQSPNDVAIGAGQLYGNAGDEAQTDGVPAADGPFTVGTGLPTTAGQSETLIDPTAVAGPGFFTGESGTPAAFVTPEQFSVSPDGQIIIVADARTNGAGGLYIFSDYNIPGSWHLDASSTFATSGLTGLSVNWSNPAAPVIYAVTTNSNPGDAQNSIVSFAATTGYAVPAFNGSDVGTIAAPATLATAPANASFRGVALAPTAPPASVAGTTATTTTFTPLPASAVYPNGSLTVTVAPGAGYAGSNIPTGSVSFQENGVEIGSAPLNSSGVATFSPTSDFMAGSYNGLVAVYTGDSNFAGSSSSAVDTTISKAAPTVTFATPPTLTTVTTGVSDPLTVTITVPAGTTPAPDSTLDGTVTFWLGPIGTGTDLGTVAVAPVITADVLSFQAAMPETFSTFGLVTINAVYSGNENFVPATASVMVNVAKASTTVVTTSLADPTATPSQNVTLYATIYGDGVTAPTGTVTFSDNGIAITQTVSYYAPVSPASFTGSIAGNILTVTGPVTGTITAGQTLGDSNIATGTTIIGQTGGTTGGDGTYTLSSPQSQTVTSEFISTTPTLVAYVTVPTALLQNAGNSPTVLLPGEETITAVYSGDSNFFTTTGGMAQSVQAKTIATGDVMIYLAGDGTNAIGSSTGALVFLDEYTPGATPVLVQSISLPTAFGTPYSTGSIIGLVASGTSSSEGEVSESTNGQYFLITGYDADLGTGNLPASTATAIPRTVAEIAKNGSMTLTALNNFASTGNPRGATSTNGTQIWLTGSTGGTVTATVGATSDTTVDATYANERRVYIYDNQLYVASASGTTPTLRIGTVGTGTPTGTATTTPLTGIPALPGQTGGTGDPNSPYGFYLTYLQPTGGPATSTTPNTLYVTQDGVNFVAGSIEKFTLQSNGTWTETGSVTEDGTNEDRDLTGVTVGGVVTLYIDGTVGGNGGGFLASFTDSTGYNGTITGSDTLSSLSIPTTEGFRGIAIVQAPIATTTTVMSNNSTPSGASATPVTFTATVQGVDGSYPVGTVQFYDNGLALGSPVSVNAGNVDVPATYTEITALTQAANKLTPGIHSITAIFTPGGNYVSSTGVIDQTVTANTFGAGDVFVYRTGDGSSTNFASGKASAVFIDEFNSTGTLEQSIAFPGTTVGAVNALTQNGSQGAGAFLNLSGDGSELILEGYTATVGATSLTTQVIGEVSANGTINTTTTDTTSVGVIRSATSNSSNSIWLGTSSDGVEYETLGSSTSIQISGSPVTNTRVVADFGGQLYISSASGSTRLASVGAGLPTTTGQTETELNGVTSAQLGSGPYSYYFTNLNGGSGFDTLYIAANDSAIGIVKYALESGTWTEVGEIPSTATTEYAGLTGITNGTTVTLYATNNIQFAATTGGNLVSIVDTTGDLGNFSSATVTTLATASTNTNFHGVAVVPGNANVTVTKSADTATVTAGATDGYTVTITNAGNDTANGVTLSDPLPAGVTWSINGGANASSFQITGSPGSQSLSLNGISTLAPGASLVVHITGTTAPSGSPFSATLTNTATVNATVETTHSQQATATITVDSPDVTVTKVADSGTDSVGTQDGYTVTISNSGLGQANGVTLSDPLPSLGGSNVWTIDGSVGNPADFTISGASLSLSSAFLASDSLAAGSSISVHILGTPTASVAGTTLSNTATVSAGNEFAALQNQSATATIAVASAGTPVSVVSMVINGTAATGVSAVEDGAGSTATITMTQSLGFYVGEPVIVSGFTTQTGFNGFETITAVSNNGLSFSYADSLVGAGLSDVNGTATPALAGVQMSMVDALVITFNQAVSLNTGAFSLSLRAFTANGVGGTTEGNTAQMNAPVSYDGGTVWVLTFSGTGNSISDGDYNLDLNHTDVVGGAGMAADYTNNFYRLFGDINGNGQVTNSANLKFGRAFGSNTTQANYVAAFDYTDSGSIGNTANLQFGRRFGSIWTSL